MLNLELVERIGQENCHIREMAALAALARKHGVPSRCDTLLETWARDWLAAHPRLGALLVARHGELIASR